MRRLRRIGSVVGPGWGWGCEEKVGGGIFEEKDGGGIVKRRMEVWDCEEKDGGGNGRIRVR
jgi:hypothetical protein